MQLPQNGQYDFAAQPRVVKPRGKYRDAQDDTDNLQGSLQQNLMFDKRVVRGNTYAAIVTTTREANQQLKTSQKVVSMKQSRRQQDQEEQDFVPRNISTPPPVEGRVHREVWTDDLVEILTDKPPNYEKDTQTDFYIDRPVNRLFMPKKTGEDTETQVWDGELFDFDYEVEPILQVLIGKTLEQSRMEVLEEEELSTMKAQQKKYDELRYAELAEAQRLEAEERRQLEESERRKNQHKIKKDQAVIGHKKLISRVLAKKFLSTLRPNAFRILGDQGNFRDPLELDVNRHFLPWMLNGVMHQLDHTGTIRRELVEISHAIASHISHLHKESIKAELERRQKLREDRAAEAQRKEEERALRKELRRKRDEERRRAELREKINETIISKAEVKEKIFTMVYSEVDSLGQDVSNIGLFGGVFGELLLLLSTIQHLSSQEHYVHFKNINFTPEIITKLIEFMLDDLFKEGAIEVGVSEELERQLADIRPDLTLENFREVAGDERERVEEAVRQTLGSIGFNFIRNNLANLEIREELYDLTVSQILKFILTKDSEYQKRLRVVKCDQNGKNPVALLQLKPDPTEAGVFVPQTQTKGSKPLPRRDSQSSAKSGGQVAGKKPQIKKKPSDQSDQAEKPEINYFEADYDEKASVIPLVNEQPIRVAVQHMAATLLLRREFVTKLAAMFKEIESTEQDIVREVCNKAKKIEELLDQQRPDLPLFEFDMY